MTYLLNVSFVFDEKMEQQFSIWMKNTPILDSYHFYRMVGSKDGVITFCAQKNLENMSKTQQETSRLHSLLHTALKKDFNEEIVFFMSALESL